MLAGYFGKVVYSLNQKRQSQLTEYLYLSENNDHLIGLLKHNYSRSISQLLSQLLNADHSNYSDCQKITDKKSEIIFQLLQKIDSSSGDSEQALNSAQTLTDLVDSSGYVAQFMQKPEQV